MLAMWDRWVNPCFLRLETAGVLRGKGMRAGYVDVLG